MKKILQSIACAVAVVAMSSTVNAQLADGSVAPDFTLTDINGEEHNLYSYLDEGKSVILDFSATWCGPCWNYHTSGALETVWEEHGPAGANDVVVIMFECDDETTQEDLEGTGGNTLGNWIEGTGYPIIDNAQALAGEWDIPGYPTMMTVCPSRIVTETGQISAEQHIAFIEANCAAPYDGVDGTIQNYAGVTSACGDLDLVVNVMSTGDESLVNPTIDFVTSDGQSGSYVHDGTLMQWDLVEMTVGTVNVVDDITVDFTVTGDDNAENNAFSQELTRNAPTTTHIRLDIVPDCWPEEIGYDIINSAGDVVAGNAIGTYNGAPLGELITEDHWLPVDCYTVRVYDDFGDGLQGTVFGCDIDGTIVISDQQGDTQVVLWDYDGSYAYETVDNGFDAVTVVGIEETEAVVANMNVFPNPFSKETTLALDLAQGGDVNISVFNTVGSLVMADFFGGVAAGTFTTPLSFEGVEAGIYMINVEVNGVTTTKRVTLTK